MASPAMNAFQAASAFDPATLRDLIVAVTIVVVMSWSALHLRKVMVRGWSRMDMAHIGTGLFLVLILVFFVFWVTAEYGAGP